MSSYRKCFLIPPTEKQCLWMSAGVLSYQLCDRMFDCDCCPLDQAMRRRFSPPNIEVGEESNIQAGAMEQEIPREGFHYSRNHWWAHQLGPRQIRLGIELGLARALQGIKGIVLPALRQSVFRGHNCVWLVMEGGTLPLEAPLDGTVRTVNDEMISNPLLLESRPFDEGWLFEMEAEDTEMTEAGWMGADEAEVRFRSDQTRFLSSVTGVMRGRRTSPNHKFPTSGEPLQSFAETLGPTRYFGLVRQHFGWAKR